ncbi:MAG: type VI secretion system ATPase TssH, partial [Gammaproteobacteria bacterium]|nr:type VI secretion system ATPase TssH [Gammaproteobacteria bacterium]
MELNLKALINKMNQVTKSALESSAGYCMNRGHYNVEIEHFLFKLLEENSTDLQRILNMLSVNPDILKTELNSSLDRLQTGNVKPPALSLELVNLIKQSWVISSIEFEHQIISSAHIIGALLIDDKLRSQFIPNIPSISQITAET